MKEYYLIRVGRKQFCVNENMKNSIFIGAAALVCKYNLKAYEELKKHFKVVGKIIQR